MSSGHGGTDQTQYLTFLLADEVYAVSILRVKEIIEYGTVTRVPNMPPSIRGVINLRGAVVPVVDLVVRFRLGESKVTNRTCVIIAEFQAKGEPVVMGLIADSVSQVIDLAPGEIEPPPSFGTSVRVDFLKGLGKTAKKFVLILDLDRVLSAEELLTASDSPAATSDAGKRNGALPAPAASEAAAGSEVHA